MQTSSPLFKVCFTVVMFALFTSSAISATPASVDDDAAHCIPLLNLTPAENKAVEAKINAGQPASEIIQQATARYLACLAIDATARQARAVASAADIASQFDK